MVQVSEAAVATLSGPLHGTRVTQQRRHLGGLHTAQIWNDERSPIESNCGQRSKSVDRTSSRPSHTLHAAYTQPHAHSPHKYSSDDVGAAATPVFVHSGRVHWIFMQRLSRGLGRRQLVHRAERVEVPRDGRVSSKSAPQSGHLTVHKAVLAFLRHREHTTSSTGWARRIAMPVHPGIVQEYARSGIEAA